MRIPPVFRRFRRVLGDCLEEKYHKSGIFPVKPKLHDGTSPANSIQYGTKSLVHEITRIRHEMVCPRNRHEKFFHESTRIRHEKACPRISRICTSAPLFPLHLYSLCTSAPTVLRPRKDTSPARKACLTTSVFYTLLINIGSIVPGAPAALGIGAASFDGEGGDVDGKDTAESPTA